MDEREREIESIRDEIWMLENRLEELENAEPEKPAEPFTCHQCKHLQAKGPTCGMTKAVIPAGFLTIDRMPSGDGCSTAPKAAVTA